jgi:hypothetical protein
MQSQSFLTKTSNTSHGRRRVLRSGGLNHPKPLCAFYVHTPIDQAFLDFPQTHPKLGLGGCTPPPHWRNPPTDSMAGCVLLSFLDCYSGYHQIALKEEDQIKTAFITPLEHTHILQCHLG